MTTGYLPREVQYTMDALEEHTGTPATLTSRPGRWHLVHGNDRITLTCTYTRTTSGKVRFSSTLSQDGKPREKVKDVAAYARLFANPDLAKPNRTPGRILNPIVPLPDGEELPEVVKSVVALGEGSDKFATVEAGHAVKAERQCHGGKHYRVPQEDEQGEYVTDPTRYCVRYTKHNGDRIQLVVGPVQGVLTVEDMAAVDQDGGDILSEEMDPQGQVEQDMSALIERLLGFRLPSSTNTASRYSAPATRTTGAVTNSVQVRKATVFRI